MEERQQKYFQKLVDQSDLNRSRAIVSRKSRVLKAYVDSHAPGKGSDMEYICSNLLDDHDQIS